MKRTGRSLGPDRSVRERNGAPCFSGRRSPSEHPAGPFRFQNGPRIQQMRAGREQSPTRRRTGFGCSAAVGGDGIDRGTTAIESLWARHGCAARRAFSRKSLVFAVHIPHTFGCWLARAETESRIVLLSLGNSDCHGTESLTFWWLGADEGVVEAAGVYSALIATARRMESQVCR